MTSQFEDTTVEELDVANLSDDQLRDIAENDSRVTAQEKAQAELNRRESASDTSNNSSTDTKEGATEQPTAPVADSLGYEYAPASEELGADQVQSKMNDATASGVWPGDGNPPDSSHTVEAVTQTPAAQNTTEPAPSEETTES